ncbi:uncharacterized protein VTP21DRAFT_1896 [Calcarisporiella thermophila]|uniref:uncharacterized protein n=1 Tax=Calcarisporiella thermophila TaxID=911321 RepID=UPI003743C5B4
MSRTHISVALDGKVYQHHLRPPKHSGAEPQEPRTWRPTRSPKDSKTHDSNRLRFGVMWAERCINTITGPQDSQVLSARSLMIGDLSESSRTARHVVQIVFDSVLWQIHRD